MYLLTNKELEIKYIIKSLMFVLTNQAKQEIIVFYYVKIEFKFKPA